MFETRLTQEQQKLCLTFLAKLSDKIRDKNPDAKVEIVKLNDDCVIAISTTSEGVAYWRIWADEAGQPKFIRVFA